MDILKMAHAWVGGEGGAVTKQCSALSFFNKN